MFQVSELKEIIEKYTTVDKLRKKVEKHLIELFNGNIDVAFIEKSLQVAKTHQSVGIEPAWYMAAFQNVQNSFLSVIYTDIQNKEDIQEISFVINKIISFEQQIVLESYQKHNTQKLNIQFENGKADLKQTMTEVSKELIALAEETQASAETLSSSMENVNQTTVKVMSKQVWQKHMLTMDKLN